MQRPSCANWVFRHLRHFVKDQRGSMSVLTISLLTAMFAVGGLALDATRLEHQRVKLQNTLDRCTLMAVTLRQKRDPEAVVRDCMDREGLEAAIKTVVPTTSANSRLLTVTASTKLSSLFPSLTGLGDLSYAAAASARYTMTKIEISLVLDVSGSMDGTRLADLKTNDCENSLAIEVVPITDWQLPPTNTACVDKPAAVDPVVTVDIGQRNDLMLVRVCLVQDLVYPTSGLSLALPTDAQGYYNIVAVSAYVNEPS